MRSYQDILNALEKPLAFAARRQGRNLQQIGNLSEVIQTLLEEAKGLELDQPEQLLLGQLNRYLAGFATSGPDEKLQQVHSALKLLRREEAHAKPERVPTREVAVELEPESESGPEPEVEPSILHQFTGPMAQPLTEISGMGLGPATLEKLARKNIQTIEELLFDFPVRFEDRAAQVPIAALTPSKNTTVRAEVVSAEIVRTRRGKKFLTVLVQDNSGSLVAKWFHYRGNKPDKRFTRGNHLILSGAVQVFNGRLEMIHPDVEYDTPGGQDAEAGDQILPIYALTEGLTQKRYRQIMGKFVRKYHQLIPEVLPVELISRLDFPQLAKSVLCIHCPEHDEDLRLLNDYRTPAQKRVIFEEFFFLGLTVELRRRNLTHLPAPPMPGPETLDSPLVQKILQCLPFSLTGAQKRVLEEIFTDLAKSFAMNRLVQGDVGSGKTVVALLAAARALENHFQVALMAPTEILAEQHYLGLSRILYAAGVTCACLTSSTTKSERVKLLERLKIGDLQVLVGTHAIIQDDIAFHKLGLVIVDEQHRFGVLQRVALRQKGHNPHALVMTATPIPRTLAMTVYGDLDLSVINELPPGRQAIRTIAIREHERDRLHRMIEQTVGLGHQVYLVYPLIEESETLDLKNAMEMFEHLKNDVFPQLNMAILHGRMKPAEKEKIMGSFKAGRIQVLVSTTVIEVGIDVPNATLMVIENAERFGLSQLHQLRGRVGRGTGASHCVLVVKKRLTPDAKQRIKIMIQTNDGFRIAEEDLKIRGPGEVLGTRQSGLPAFYYADLRRDAELFHQGMKEARHLLQDDPDFTDPANKTLKEALQIRYQGRLKLSRIG